jgi:hypothetical protein|tara:strand:- start:275 stop:475 length:201 start_codon:yes stop_codon:yes gene_type:complete
LKVGIAIATVFIPLLGIIMGIIFMMDDHPEKKAAGKLWLGIGGGMFALNVICICACVMFGAVAEGM